MNYTYGVARVSGAGTNYYISSSSDEFVIMSTVDETEIWLMVLNTVLRTSTGKEVFIPTTSGLNNVAYIYPTTSGIGGVDIGSFANDTWYGVWLLYNPSTGDIGGVISLLSSVTPTLPDGYTYYKRVGVVRSASVGNNFIKVEKFGGRWTFYKELITIKDGSFTATPAWTSINIANYIPSTASRARFLFGSAENVIGLSESSSGFGGIYGRFADASSTTDFGLGCTARDNWLTGEISLDIGLHSLIYYYVTSADSTLIALGWEE